MPQPLKYHQLIEKLQELCGSKFTVEYSAAKGEVVGYFDDALECLLTNK